MTYAYTGNAHQGKQNRRTWRKKSRQYMELARKVRGYRIEAINKRFALTRCARFCRRMAWSQPQ